MADRQDGTDWRGKDGRDWRIGSEAEVRWIGENTEGGVRITSAIPPVFGAYARLELPGSGNNEALSSEASDSHDSSVLNVLVEYVLVEAGPEQARTWRGRTGRAACRI